MCIHHANFYNAHKTESQTAKTTENTTNKYKNHNERMQMGRRWRFEWQNKHQSTRNSNRIFSPSATFGQTCLDRVLMVCEPGEIWLVLFVRLAPARVEKLSKRALGRKQFNFRWPQSCLEWVLYLFALAMLITWTKLTKYG